MSKSAIYTVNNSELNVVDGNIIPLGTIIRRYGQNVRQDGNSITLCDKGCCAGYYKVDIVATLEPAAAADYKVILEKNGTPVIGGVAQLNGVPAASIVPFVISVIVKNTCGDSASLGVKLEGGDAKVINMTTVVEKL